MQKQSARIKCKNNLLKPVHSVRTTAYDQNSNIQSNDIFTSLRRKKVQSLQRGQMWRHPRLPFDWLSVSFFDY